MGFSDVYRSVLKDYPDVLTVEEMSRALGISTKDRLQADPGKQDRELKSRALLSNSQSTPSFVYALGYEIPTGFLIAHWTSAAEPDKLVSANSRSPIDQQKEEYFYGSRTSARKKRHLLHGAILPKRKWKTEKQMDFNQASGKGKQEKAEKMLSEIRQTFVPVEKPMGEGENCPVSFSKLPKLSSPRPPPPPTSFTYSSNLKKIVVPYFERKAIPLAELKAIEIQSILFETVGTGFCKNGDPLSHAAAPGAEVCRKIELIDANPVDKVDRPKAAPRLSAALR